MPVLPRRVQVDRYTPTAALLEMLFKGHHLSIGSCLFWAAASGIYLVTNWHNLSGVDPITGSNMSATGGRPDRVQFLAFPNRDLNNRQGVVVGLHDQQGDPTWLEHPTLGRSVDVACVLLPPEWSNWIFPINQLPTEPLLVQVADEIFILGFPMGIHTDRLPIWKRASIASEPGFDVDGLPKFYADTATARGMSGSPVIKKASGMAMFEDGSAAMHTGPVYRFLGIYSGRRTSGDPVEAQLGIVWKPHVIEEIINGQTFARF